ncbi:hypothetical protein [Variovorax sp. IB41]|nr:hypothetical protein [Variovorax sp. IB41]
MNVAAGGTANDSAGNAANAANSQRAFDQSSPSQWLCAGATGS